MSKRMSFRYILEKQAQFIITKSFINGWLEEQCPISIFTDNYLYIRMSSWTKTWNGVKRDKDWENETEPKVSLYMLP